MNKFSDFVEGTDNRQAAKFLKQRLESKGLHATENNREILKRAKGGVRQTTNREESKGVA